MSGKLVIFSAPSGTGKSTIINYLMGEHRELGLTFSVSATSRPPRGTEQDGVEYHFLSPEDFRARIERGDFLEYNEVYHDRFYGTLRSEVEDRLAKGQNVVLDVDVDGGCRIKEMYGERAIAVFIMPPSIDALRMRLENRGTDDATTIAKRLERAEYEISFAPKYDRVVVNDVLDDAKADALKVLREFL